MNTTKKIGIISLAGLAYSILIAYWIGTRTAFDIAFDIFNNYIWDTSIQQALVYQLFVLTILAILSTIIFVWFSEKISVGNLLLIVISFSGILLTIALLIQGARLPGTITCSLSFLGVFYTGLRGIAEKHPKRVNVPSILSSAWKRTITSAIGQGIPISILSISTSREISQSEIFLISKELRSDDKVVPVEDGMVILLWNTNVDKAQLVSGNIIKFLSNAGYSDISIGISGLPDDSNEAALLVEKANVALEIAKVSYKKQVIIFRELIFSPEVEGFFSNITHQISEYIIRLQSVWEITQKKGWPLTAIAFYLEAKDDETIVISHLHEWLRGIDEVGILNPGIILAVLLNTPNEGCQRLAQKLKEQLSELTNQQVINQVKIEPIIKLNLAKDFGAFIKTIIRS